MPYTIRKVNRRNCYRVMNKYSKRIMSKCTSLAKAKRQRRLLNGIHYNKSFAKKLRKTKKRKKSRKSR